MMRKAIIWIPTHKWVGRSEVAAELIVLRATKEKPIIESEEMQSQQLKVLQITTINFATMHLHKFMMDNGLTL